MRNMFFKSLYIFIFLPFSGASCSDMVEEISEHYYYVFESIESQQIGYTGSKMSYIGGGKESVYGTVIDYDYNDDFIVALQKPNFLDYQSSMIYKLPSGLGYFPIYNHEELEADLKITDSILRHDPYYQRIFRDSLNYWIVCLEKDSVIGPLDKKEYTWARKRLHIPDNVKIDDHIEIDWYYTDKKR